MGVMGKGRASRRGLVSRLNGTVRKDLVKLGAVERTNISPNGLCAAFALLDVCREQAKRGMSYIRWGVPDSMAPLGAVIAGELDVFFKKLFGSVLIDGRENILPSRIGFDGKYFSLVHADRLGLDANRGGRISDRQFRQIRAAAVSALCWVKARADEQNIDLDGWRGRPGAVRVGRVEAVHPSNQQGASQSPDRAASPTLVANPRPLCAPIYASPRAASDDLGPDVVARLARPDI